MSLNKTPEFLAEADYGITLIDSLKPIVNLKDLNITSIRQCIGTNRLWGANLGLAAYIDLKTTIIPKEIFLDLAILSRTYLVLDDHLKDEYLNEQTIQYCTEWLTNVSDGIKDIYKKLDEDFNNYLSLVETGNITYKNRVHRNNVVDVYRSSIDKSLIFFVPTRTNYYKNNSDYYEQRISFLEDFFFCCQLLDDYFDIEEDINKKTNHNIFLENLPKEYWQVLLTNRTDLLISLLWLLKNNFVTSTTKENVADNIVFEHYFKASTYWIDNKIRESKGVIIQSVAEQNFQDFLFNKHCLKDLLNNLSVESKSNYLDDVRPEIFQASYIGINEIEKV